MTSHNLPLPRPVTAAERFAAAHGDCDIGTLARVVMCDISIIRDRDANFVMRRFALFRARRVLYAWEDKDHPTYQSLMRQTDTADFATQASMAA